MDEIAVRKGLGLPSPIDGRTVYTGDVGTALSKITNPGRNSLEPAFIWGM